MDMRNIVFIGNSIAHVSAIEELLKSTSDLSLTVISSDADLPYSRNALMHLLSKDIKDRQVFYRPEAFYKERKVRYIVGQNVSRINFKRNQVFLENKDQLSYSALVISDVADPRLPEIKGHNKIGVFDAVRLSSVKEMVDQLIFVQTIVVQVNTWQGFLTVCALSNYNKEIIVVTSGDHLLPDNLDAESSCMLKQILEFNGIRMMMGNPIEEILGDSDLKAVRLRSGKVLSAEMVILDDLYCDTRLFKDSGFERPDQISNVSSFLSNIPNVYWADAMKNNFISAVGADYRDTDVELVWQGKSIANEILGSTDIENKANVDSVNKFAIKGSQGVWFGSCIFSQEAKHFSRFYPETNTYIKIFCSEGLICGGVLLNNSQETISTIVDLYSSKTNVQGKEDQLLDEHRPQESLVDAQP